MSALPQGTVTFLFTDIEGSTALLKRLGDALRRGSRGARSGSCVRRRRALRRDVRSTTRATRSSSPSRAPNAALGAAVVAQRALAAHEWPDGAEVRVRMGLHTGEPVGRRASATSGSACTGRRVSARRATAGRCCSPTPTRELVEEELGRRRRPRTRRSTGSRTSTARSTSYQLDIGGLPSHFPPLKAEKVESGRHFSRRPVVIGALAGVIAAAVAIPVFAFGGGSGQAGASVDAAGNNTLAIIGPGAGRLVADPTVGATPTAVAFGEGAYWVANADGSSVSRVDPVTNEVADTIVNVGSGPSGITTGNGFVWVTNSLDGTVAKIDPRTNSVVQSITVGNGPVGILYAAGAVWVANTADGTITRIDASTAARPRSRYRSPPPSSLSETALSGRRSAPSARWCASIPSPSAVVAPIRVGNGPTGIAFGDGSAWVANSLDGTVSRIDPATNSVAATIPTGGTPTGVAVDASGVVWVANQYGGTLQRIDPKTNQPGKPIDVGNQPQGIEIGGRTTSRERHRPAGRRPPRRDADDGFEFPRPTRSTPPPPTRRRRGRFSA